MRTSSRYVPQPKKNTRKYLSLDLALPLVRQEVSESEHEQQNDDDEPEAHAAQAPKPRSGLPSLPPRRAGRASTVVTTTNAGAASGGAAPAPLNPKMAKIREQVQGFRTNIYRAAMRLRYPVASQMINQVMFRLQMAEKIHLEEHGSAVSAGDAEGDALEEAERLEEAGVDLDFSTTVLVLGMAGSGRRRR